MFIVNRLNVKIFADGARLSDIVDMYQKPYIKGFTTNPTLMRKAGISDYEKFAKDVLTAVPDRPVSFEVFADDFDKMYRQARKIAEWGRNVYVKIPITNTKGESTFDLCRKLTDSGVQVNITAITTTQQVMKAIDSLKNGASGFISVFAGRIADTGIDPKSSMATYSQWLAEHPNLELIWASPREVLNIVQANEAKCHIITATPDILKKLPLLGKDLTEYSLETVQMFYDDGKASNFKLEV